MFTDLVADSGHSAGERLQSSWRAETASDGSGPAEGLDGGTETFQHSGAMSTTSRALGGAEGDRTEVGRAQPSVRANPRDRKGVKKPTH